MPRETLPNTLEERIEKLEKRLRTSELGTPPETVTELPTEPTDGQVIHYLADEENGIVWDFRYRASSASIYKWEFIGGSPLSEVAGGGTLRETAGTNVISVNADSPKLVLPLAGHYLLLAKSLVLIESAGITNVLASLHVTSTTGFDIPPDTFRLTNQHVISTGLQGSYDGKGLATNVLASKTIQVSFMIEAEKVKYKMFGIYLEAIPERVK
jgi:hypothetical protein